MWIKFKTCLPGKWVLVGEHAVMRGGMAIVFPFLEASPCSAYWGSFLCFLI
jgi:mevalonate kinase